MNRYIEKDHQQLAYGYTTGSCAAAAAKAAAQMLFSQEEVTQVRLMTPKGFELLLEITEICRKKQEGSVSCAVRKDAGDDPDATDGTLVYAEVSRCGQSGIHIDGGKGVGRVTKPGLDQPVGAAAINSVPRRMIEREVQAILTQSGESCGLRVIISIPAGEELAAKTFNPKLGIVGGISVLGTTGIVEPMSEQALLDTIAVEMRVRKSEGYPLLPMAPGNYGRAFMQEKYGFAMDTAVECSNFVGDALKIACESGFTRLLFIGHIGKLVKVAGGIMNTHSKYGDHRMEILTELSEKVCTGDQKGIGEKLAACVSTDEAVRILKEYHLDQAVLAKMTQQIKQNMEAYTGHRMQVEVIVFSNVYGELGKTEQALEYIGILNRKGNS